MPAPEDAEDRWLWLEAVDGDDALAWVREHNRRARCRSELGNSGGANADWKQIALSYPTHPYAVAALSELAKPPSPWKASLEERARRVRAFIQAGSPSSCLKELDLAERAGLVRGAGRGVMQAVFAIPGALNTPTGGYTYDRQVLAALVDKARPLGLAVRGVGLRDIILPGDMKSLLNQVIAAR